MELLYNVLIITQFSLSYIVFFVLLFITAPYGKHTKKGWGLRIDSKIGWFLMEIPAFFIICLMFLIFKSNINIILIIFLFFWQLHYVYRTFIYPFILRSSKKTFPVLLILFAVIFNSVNGFIMSYYLLQNSNLYDINWIFTPQFIIGTIIFLTGFSVHVYSDKITRKLRTRGETGYNVTSEGLFKYVSNPNYLGEIFQWFGFALLTLSPASLAFALFTTANLVPRAISNHKWYIANFENYPKDRKILIPYIF
jgi:protein-S-isoprenylcysteine O-methyltransferase Ste14